MRVTPGLVLAVAVLLAGCGGDSRRDEVDDYLQRVERAESTVLERKGQIDLALGRFTLDRPRPADVVILEQAEKQLRTVAQDVRSLTPPREARALHRDVVRLFVLQADVTRDLLWAARYVPRFREALGPLRPASTRLGSDLRTARTSKAVAEAFAAYRRSLEGVLRALQPLSAPPSLRPSLEGQRQALGRGIALSLQIEDAVARGDASGVESAAVRLSGLASDREAARSRAAEIRAAKAYNRRLRQIAALAQKVETTRRGLNASVE